MGSLSLTEAPSPTAKLLNPLFDEFWFDERELHLRHRNTRMFGEIGVPVMKNQIDNYIYLVIRGNKKTRFKCNHVHIPYQYHLKNVISNIIKND